MSVLLAKLFSRSAQHRRPAGFSLAEMAVVLGIIGLLVAVAVPGFARYRGHTGVNTATEVTEGLLIRAREEARSSGYPLPDSLRSAGVPTLAPTGRQGGSQATLIARVRKRHQGSEPPQVLSSRELSVGSTLEVQVDHLGVLDLDADVSLEGVYFELLMRVAGTDTPLATVPVDVNGEMVLQGAQAQGAIHFVYSTYSRSLSLSRRGVITPDRR